MKVRLTFCTAGESSVPLMTRVRSLLKLALRAFRLRCTHIEEITE
mgnify:CR=1 FL=1